MYDSGYLGVLYSPYLPQMNDGYINATELQSDGGVIVEILRYSDAKSGDYIELYWDGSSVNTLLISDPDSMVWPWSTVIMEGLADGPHQVWYQVTDIAGNTTTSPQITAIIDRNHTGTLPPPEFTDADAENTITYASVIQNSGTHIYVPYESGAYVENDIVYVYWKETDSEGATIDSSETFVSHTVTADDINSGFTVLIDPSFITLTPSGTGSSWYSVIPQTGQNQSSDVATVLVDMSETTVYPAPVIVPAADGWITCDEITGAGIAVTVNSNEGFAVGSKVTVYWQGYNENYNPIAASAFNTTQTLSATDVANGFTVLIPEAYALAIGIGYAKAWYSVFEPSVPGTSQASITRLDAVHCTLLPAPIFIDADATNTLYVDDIVANNGIDVRVAYPNMLAGDSVKLFWQGETINTVNWASTTIVTSADETQQSLTFHVPAEYVTPIAEGVGDAIYQVVFIDSGAAMSLTSSVNISNQSSNSLIINCSTSAPVFDAVVPIRPINTVVIYGPAGSDVIISLPNGSQAFFNPDGVQSLTLRLDSTGRASADVYCFSVGNIEVSAYIATDPSISAVGNMTFTNWLAGNSDITYYGVTTGAVADGIDTCSVWFHVSEYSTTKDVRLVLSDDNSAIIPMSGSKTSVVNVADSDVGGFDIVDLVADSVSYTLSLPGDSSAYLLGSLQFVRVG